MSIIKALVTGGAGFIGSNFVRYLKQNTDWHITVLDSLTYAGSLDNLEGVIDDISFVLGDICSPETVTFISNLKPDFIFNFAAETHVDNSIADSGIFMKTNILGVKNLLDAYLLNPSVKRFIQISTDEVYGELGHTGMFKETDPLKPRNPYSASKASAEHFCNAYVKTYDLDVVITRGSNTFGPRQHKEKFIPKIITNALKDEKVPLYGKGEQIRDWLYVDDHCSAILAVTVRGRKGEIYNIGGSNEMKNIDTIFSILSEMNKNVNLIEFVPDRIGHDFRYALDTTKIKNQLYWTPSVSWEEGIKNTINWYTKHTFCKV